MKLHHLAFTLLVLVFACSKSDKHHEGHEVQGDNATDSPNEALYHQVMDIHDEVMPKMEDLYTLKKQLQEKIESTPDLVAEEKKKMEDRIAHLDSASQLMMEWMHQFNPLPDSTDQEEAREYLESEMEKIKKVKDAMLEAIDKEKNAPK
jgi:regulator of replication initiation timing